MLYFTLFIILSIALFGWVFFSYYAMQFYRHTPQLSETLSNRSVRAQPSVTLIVPARNEAHRIRNCIKSLKAQKYKKMKVIIVDDFSTDDTVNVSMATIGADKRFKMLNLKSICQEKPDGWNGKSYALQQGSLHTRSKWLVFIDADVSLTPDIVDKAMTYAIDHHLDLLSVLPQHHCDSFWTKVVHPIPLESLLINIYMTNKQESKIGFAFGCFIVIKHSVFDALAGYETIKDKIVDECELARLMKRTGFKISIINAQDMIQVETYKGFREISEGWSKNIFLGIMQNTNFRSKLLKAFLILIGCTTLFSAFLFPLLVLITSLLLGVLFHVPHLEVLVVYSLVVCLLGVVMQYRIQQRYAIGDPNYAALSFLGATVYLGIFINATLKFMLGKGSTWKGRVYK